MKIDKILINNLRCFLSAKSTIRPITVIVGENNTGKTTFLSAYKLIHDLLYEDNPIKPSSIEDLLKVEIYKYLGGAKHIVRKQSSDDTVNIGATLKVGEQHNWQVEYSIKNGKSCEKILIHCSNDKIEINLKENNMMEFLVNGQEGYHATIPAHFSIHFFGVMSFLYDELKKELKKNRILLSKITTLIRVKENGDLKNISCNLLEPTHLKPKAQYNSADIKTTDPSYVLCEMAKMKKNNNWNTIREKLNKFGRDSKLFQSLDIDIPNKNQPEPPFSIKVTVDELKSDITNVGYGVSQFLPILANVFISDHEKHNTFLMQQPETHLHPRVEAEFATLMISMINQHKFICETHSDYIIQRARIAIKEKTLKPEDFLILYFELKNGETKVYPVTIDSNGNFENQPDSYKAFFLSEDYKLLGLKS